MGHSLSPCACRYSLHFAMWKFLASQSDNKWQLRQFLTHVTTFHNLCMTLTTNGDGILMTVKTNGKDTLMTPRTDGEDTLKTLFTTHNYLVTTPNDITDNPCDDIDDLYGHCPHDWDQVMKRTTRWQQERLATPTDDVASLVWWPMWLLLTTREDQSDDQHTTPMTLMTTGDYLGWSMWRPVDDPGNFLTTFDDSIWRYLSPKSKVACLADAHSVTFSSLPVWGSVNLK